MEIAELLPQPAVVRKWLANNYREARILRSLLQLSESAATNPGRRNARLDTGQQGDSGQEATHVR